MVSHRSFSLKVLFRTFAVVLVSLLLIEAFLLQNNGENNKANVRTTTRTRMMMMMNAATEPTAHLKEAEAFRDGSKRNDLSYLASKRKVPRGPDPIHNRRAGNSRRPPGRA